MGGDTWKKIGRGILAVGTLGISEAVIGGMNAADAIGSLGDATEQLGAFLAVLTDTTRKVGDQANQMLYDIDDGWIRDRETGQPGEITKLIGTLDETTEDIDDLFSVERLTARDEAELWPSERERLSELYDARARAVSDEATYRRERDDLAANLKGRDLPPYPGAGFPFDWSPVFEAVIEIMAYDTLNEVDIAEGYFRMCHYPNMDEIHSICNSLKTRIAWMNIRRDQIVMYDTEIRRILFNEPGLVPIIAYNVNEVIERFNTIEQPKIEDILDSIDDTMEETHEVMAEVKKLFVVKTRKPVAIGTLPAMDLRRLQWLEAHRGIIEAAMMKEFDLADTMHSQMAQMKPVLDKLTVVGK